MSSQETGRAIAGEVERALAGEAVTQHAPLARIGVAVPDPVKHRLLEGVALQLELAIEDLTEAAMDAVDTSRFEVIIADRPAAQKLQRRVQKESREADGVHAAVVSMASGVKPDGAPDMPPLDGLIELPQEPAALLAQLSVVLYAHRAFAQRYGSAMEELRLNRRIFRSVTSGISVADATRPDLPLTYVNPAFEVMTGYSLEETQGKNCRFLQRDDRSQPALEKLREAIAQRKQVTVVLRNYRKDGSCFWNELSLAPIRNRDGMLTHFVGIQNDVSARVEFEAALRESEKLAAVGRLAASIAHEINNPLESVMNLLYLAQNEEDLLATKRYVNEADSEVKRIALITTQSLRFYRQNTRPEAVDLDELIRSVLELYTPKFTRFHIGVEHRRSTHTRVVCLESEIRQVLSNLVRNSIDAMRAHGGCLTVSTREMTEWRTGQQGVAVTVADDGSGIADDTLKSLYTAFFTTKGDRGTGLGLWVSAAIVERHHGRLLVRSTQNPQRHGTVFTMFLPYRGLDNVQGAAEAIAYADTEKGKREVVAVVAEVTG